MKIIAFILSLLLYNSAFAQTDSTKILNEVVVKGYYSPQSLLRSTSAVSILDSNQISLQQNSGLVSLINTAPGVRMEERSPGSYRLSLRGSLLRSPFGIRNIRIYIDDFPLTDAGGNTYLNLLDVAAIGSIEIYKGPEASIFGANTGGAVLINPVSGQINKIELAFTSGSYGLLHQSATLQKTYPHYNFSITQTYQQSNGFRENSALKKKYLQTAQEWNYNLKGKLKAFILYSDLNYETPGGLTIAELTINPQFSRPATPTLPSAIQQRAAIYNETFFAGLSNSYNINAHFKHVIALFTSTTAFRNPFITNYEKRAEKTFGFRTFVEYATIQNNAKYQLQIGVEHSNTKNEVENFKNNGGNATAMQASDDLKAQQEFSFIRLNLDINQRILIEAGASLNFFTYRYKSYFPIVIPVQKRNFNTQLMPKLAASYLIDSNFTVRGSIGKGYSPPTLAEVRSSNRIINTALEAESGWNYEGGLRFQNNKKSFYVDANVFYFQLQHAIVRGLNANDAEYFINAGGTKQLGTEFQGNWSVIAENKTHLINSLWIRSSYTYSHFRFQSFQNAKQDYSGNRLTGVPNHTLVSNLIINLKKGFYGLVQHNYTSAIPLNDGNTIFANQYNVLDFRGGIKNLHLGKVFFELSFGINNIFNEQYSLGNDLNAANDRYFNPAAGINYDTGIKVKL